MGTKFILGALAKRVLKEAEDLDRLTTERDALDQKIADSRAHSSPLMKYLRKYPMRLIPSKYEQKHKVLTKWRKPNE